jgi:drug/metabolite transporter (DMT)-like permease
MESVTALIMSSGVGTAPTLVRARRALDRAVAGAGYLARVPRAAHPARGYAFTLGAAALFAVNGTISTLALQAGIPATRLTALRCTGGALVLLTVLLVVSPGRLRVRVRELPFLAAFGVVGIAMTQFLYYVAIGRLPIGIALVFEFTAPVLIALYVWLVRREHVRRRLWAALLLSLSGLVLVAQVWEGGGSLDPVGVAVALLAAVCLAAYYLMGERGTGTRDPVALTCWSFLAAALFWAVAAPWWEFQPGVLGEPVPISIGSIELPLWLLVVWIVVPGSILPFWLSISALPHIWPTTAGLVATIEPVFASIVAWLWVEQVLTGWQVLGGVVVLTGIALAQTARTKPAPTPLPETPLSVTS